MECEFDGENGITVVRPKTWKSEGFTYPENDSQKCQAPDCFTKSLNYGISADQMQVNYLP